MQDEIIYPGKGKNDPDIGPVAVMVAMEKDLALLRRSMGIKGNASARILTSRLYRATSRYQDITVVGPMLGAPHAVMVLEKLIALGAKKLLFLGWCGSIQKNVRIADFVVPDQAMIGEGTSEYYGYSHPYNDRPRPSSSIIKAIDESLRICSFSFHKGCIWSTDAPYRETRQKVVSLQKEGVLGVDMETSALFAAARFRKVQIGALHVVSDELGSLCWKPGFSNSKFKNSRKKAAEVIPAICKRL